VTERESEAGDRQTDRERERAGERRREGGREREREREREADRETTERQTSDKVLGFTESDGALLSDTSSFGSLNLRFDLPQLRLLSYPSLLQDCI
jgi:septal ring factor EnvC (AmiA/AmiB activator)